MGSVGISFGSPTSGQGFDVSTTVSAIVANLQAVETPWKNQLTTLQSQDTALTSIGTDLSSLSTALNALNAFDGVFRRKGRLELRHLGAGADQRELGGGGRKPYGRGGQGGGDVFVRERDDGRERHAEREPRRSAGRRSRCPTGRRRTAMATRFRQNNTLATLASYINDGDYGVQANVVTGSAGRRSCPW